MQQMLSSIRSIAGDAYVFQQDSALQRVVRIRRPSPKSQKSDQGHHHSVDSLPVVVEQCVDDGVKQLGILRREVARPDHIDTLAQFRDSLVIRSRIVPTASEHRPPNRPVLPPFSTHANGSQQLEHVGTLKGSGGLV